LPNAVVVDGVAEEDPRPQENLRPWEKREEKENESKKASKKQRGMECGPAPEVLKAGRAPLCNNALKS
jgi:hypothetical protein